MTMMRQITSPQNELVKRWASLRDAKHRRAEKLFLLDGPRLVDEALRSSLNVVAVCSSDAAWLRDLRVPKACHRYEVTSAIIAKCSTAETPQPSFAIAELPAARTDFDWSAVKVGLLLDAVQDPGNIGAILRAAAAGGVDLVVMGEGCVDLYSPKAVRAAMGATFRVPVAHRPLEEVVPLLKKAGCRVLASVLRAGAESCFDVELRARNIAWVVGNEGNGIRASLLTHVDRFVAIPMSRGTESLNVAQATAVLLYETARQKRYDD